jgi:alpha-beta hydrolase superfamily lysophospholipase
MRHETGTLRAHDGLALFRQSWHPVAGARAAVVNLHGLGDHSGLHRPLVEHLVASGIAVHGLDFRGHGRSPGPRAYIENWTDFRADLDRFLALVAAAEPELPLFVAGNSLGGLVALEYVLTPGDGRRPGRLRGVIALAPPLGDVGVPPALMALGRVMSKVWPRFSLEVGMDLTGLSRDPGAAAEVLADPLFHRRGTARLSTEVTAAIERVQAAAPRLDTSVLLLHGTADRMVPPEGTRRFAARAGPAHCTLVEYPGAYHALAADLDAPAVLADLSAWIDAHLKD